MAWEEFERDGAKGMTGDQPIDEMALALGRVVRAYEDRFSRKPMMAEIVRALETVVSAQPARYVHDPEGLALGTIVVRRGTAEKRAPVDPARYEGSYTDVTVPGYYLVSERASKGQRERPVIKVSTIALRGRTARVDFEPLADEISDEDAALLVVKTLLVDFNQDEYRGRADTVELVNLRTGATRTIPYPSR
jgi:hypothetical protein